MSLCPSIIACQYPKCCWKYIQSIMDYWLFPIWDYRLELYLYVICFWCYWNFKKCNSPRLPYKFLDFLFFTLNFCYTILHMRIGFNINWKYWNHCWLSRWLTSGCYSTWASPSSTSSSRSTHSFSGKFMRMIMKMITILITIIEIIIILLIMIVTISQTYFGKCESIRSLEVRHPFL